MGFPSSLHVHSLYSDGKNPMEDYIQSAIAKGFLSIGFSDHVYTAFDTYYCMKQDDFERYIAELAVLKEKYRGRIEVLAGIENDYLASIADDRLDYTIGSVHYLVGDDGTPQAVDENPELYAAAYASAGAGDPRIFCARYYALIAQTAREMKPNIIGHLDIIEKFNADGKFFDNSAGWYLDIAESAIREIKKSGCVVEINTAGFLQRDGDEAYPCRGLITLLHDCDVPVTISADAHRVERLDDGFDRAATYLRAAGYHAVMLRRASGFEEFSL